MILSNKECIEIIKNNCYSSNLLDLEEIQRVNTALDKAIVSLEYRHIWAKLRKELFIKMETVHYELERDTLMEVVQLMSRIEREVEDDQRSKKADE